MELMEYLDPITYVFMTMKTTMKRVTMKQYSAHSTIASLLKIEFQKLTLTRALTKE